ncbi:PDZ domain-containing protein [Magnetovibrio sp. PR-2]|uniref:PDZ domain-containing protein n=1 Tax=Magnetovibrio sp. PR-2 TaxID=3120356 RepID=UPI002FCE64FD
MTSLNSGQSRALDIAATGPWRDSAVNVKAGERYTIATQGTWSAGPFCGNTDAGGLKTETLMCMKAIFANAFPHPDAPIGALIAKVGKDGQPFVVSDAQPLSIEQDGTLFLRMNDPDAIMFDNSGFIEVTIERHQETTAQIPEQSPEQSMELESVGPQATPHAPTTPRAPLRLQPNKTNQHVHVPRAQGTGFYGAEQDIGFNVLDNMAYDLHTGQLTLGGHFDPSLGGPRIPYLQHLATLLEQPEPQVSLDWTREFESRIAAFFDRMDNAENMARLVGSGRLMDDNGNVTHKGRVFLPVFGVKAFDHGRTAGALGAETRMKELGVLEITSITPGSAADRAGLRVGQTIHHVSRNGGLAQQPFLPATLTRFVRFAGEGAQIQFHMDGYNPDTAIPVTLDGYAGDSWAHMTRYDIIERIMRAGNKPKAANVIQAVGEFVRNQSTPAGELAMQSIMYATNSNQVFETNKARYTAGDMSKADMMADWMRALVLGMEDAMELPRNALLSVWETEYQRTGDALGVIDTVIGEMNRLAAPMVATALRTALYKNDHISMPISILDPSLDFTPEVTPRFVGLDPTSELARLFVEADYIAKAIVHMPVLSDHVSGYKTEYEFGEARPGAVTDTSNRLWIEPGRMQVQRNRDNSALQFGKTEMRINVARAISSQAERYDDGYSRYLTRLYADLAKEFSPLHELREAAKLAVAARWIKSLDPGFKLPPKGRTRLDLPETLEGFVTLIWSPKRVKVSLIAPGGIDFKVPPIGPSGPVFPGAQRVNIPIDASVVDLSTFDVVTPKPFEPAVQTKVTPNHRRLLTQPPVPSSVRLVGRATKGQRTLSRLDGFRTQALAHENRCDGELSRATSEHLVYVRSIAQKLQGVEDALNAITAQLPERQRTFARLNIVFKDEQAHLREAALDLASSGLLGVYDELKGAKTFRSIQDFETLLDTLRASKSKLRDLSLKLANLDLAISAAAARSLEEREQATLDLLHFVKDSIGDASNVSGSPALTRALRVSAATLNIGAKAQRAVDAVASLYMLQDAAETLNSLETVTEAEGEGLKTSLLALQRTLADELSTALSHPLMMDLQNPSAKLDCAK